MAGMESRSNEFGSILIQKTKEGAVSELHTILKRTFGYDTFRQRQEEIIESVLAGNDTLGVLPTGAGKSLCYQLPSMLLPKPTLVVSPLIALMKDQLEGLPEELSSRAVLLNSSLEFESLQTAKDEILSGRKTLIFVAPERLRQSSFLAILKQVGLSMMVIDEAHCVSVWGHDFRPDYLFIKKALDNLAKSGLHPIVLALTATATPEMQNDISVQLGRSLNTFQGELFRSNLRLEVRRCSNIDDKTRELLSLCKETEGATVVYANSKDRCEKLAETLRKKGHSASHYHAGMTREERKTTQEAFMKGEIRIIVATVAFGMGIDKSNVRMVAHFTLPASLEAYSQEAGRAGRDGALSRCVLLFATADKANLSRWFKQEEMKLDTIRNTYLALKERIGALGTGQVNPVELLTAVFGEGANEEWGAESRLRVAISILEIVGVAVRHADVGGSMMISLLAPPKTTKADTEALLKERNRISVLRLERMAAYTESSKCRHAMILHHFGSEMGDCKTSCDHCLGVSQKHIPKKEIRPPNSDEIPDFGRVILSAISKLLFPVGRTSLAQGLVGFDTGPLSKDNFESFGALSGCTRSSIMGYVDQLKASGSIEMTTVRDFPVLALTPEGEDSLETDDVILPNPLKAKRTPSNSKDSASGARSNSEDDLLFENLRRWRRSEAERLKVPPYVVCHDSLLRSLVDFRPKSISELSLVPGVGSRKMAAYGDKLIQLLAEVE